MENANCVTRNYSPIAQGVQCDRRRGGKYLPFCAHESTQLPVKGDVSTLFAARVQESACAALRLYKRRTLHPSLHSITPTQNVRFSREKANHVHPKGSRCSGRCTCSSSCHFFSSSPFSFARVLALFAHNHAHAYIHGRTHTDPRVSTQEQATIEPTRGLLRNDRVRERFGPKHHESRPVFLSHRRQHEETDLKSGRQFDD